jgi:hypothetical protein
MWRTMGKKTPLGVFFRFLVSGCFEDESVVFNRHVENPKSEIPCLPAGREIRNQKPSLLLPHAQTFDGRIEPEIGGGV